MQPTATTNNSSDPLTSHKHTHTWYHSRRAINTTFVCNVLAASPSSQTSSTITPSLWASIVHSSIKFRHRSKSREIAHSAAAQQRTNIPAHSLENHRLGQRISAQCGRIDVSRNQSGSKYDRAEQSRQTKTEWRSSREALKKVCWRSAR